MVISFGLYLAILIGVGILSYRLSSTLSDFILAGRRLGAWVVAISAQASDMSGWLLLGLPGAVIKNGISMVWTAIGCAGGTLFNWSVIAKRLRRYSEILGALTIP
ncbi:MAG: sodium/proline symporter PutP, partial [Deltaproteobacteria bacterium]